MKKWKTAFIILACVDLAVVLGLVILLVWASIAPGNGKPHAHRLPMTSAPIFTVRTDKDRLVALINDEIDRHPTGNLDFHVAMNDGVDLVGTLKLFGLDIPFTMRFDPEVNDQGNIVLKEKAVKLGRFNLPESEVLRFIRAGGKLPDWVTVNPSQNEIIIALDQVKVGGRFYLKAKTIDLTQDVFEFNVYRVRAKK